MEKTITIKLKNAEQVFPQKRKVSSHDLSIIGEKAFGDGLITLEEKEKLENIQYELQSGSYGGGGDRIAVAKGNKVRLVSLD